ncbi:MAG: hypothetical protein ACK5JT_23850 [Hyphomicrobiaceae bacterium]
MSRQAGDEMDKNAGLPTLIAERPRPERIAAAARRARRERAETFARAISGALAWVFPRLRRRVMSAHEACCQVATTGASKFAAGH